MTIQPTARGVPPLPPSSTPKSGNLKDAASKVSKAAGVPVQGAPTAASFPTTAAAASPLTPDPQKVAATVKQSVRKEMNLMTFLKMAPEVRDIVLPGLSDKELKSFEVALSKGTTLQDSDKIAFQKLKSQISQNQQNRIIQEILADHPAWKSHVEAWKGVSLEDKIWLLQLYELRNLGVEIPQIVKQKDSEFIPSQLTPELLKPNVKAAITAALNAVTELDWSCSQLEKCPRAICLLGNLKELDLNENNLTTPPDVNKNVKLELLDLTRNQLKAPPDVSDNVNLKKLYLYKNCLIAPPDISKNVNLQILGLSENKLTVSPDVSKNVNLQILELSINKLTAPPDVSKNVNMTKLYLVRNQLTIEAKRALEKLKIERKNLCILD